MLIADFERETITLENEQKELSRPNNNIIEKAENCQRNSTFFENIFRSEKSQDLYDQWLLLRLHFDRSPSSRGRVA